MGTQTQSQKVALYLIEAGQNKSMFGLTIAGYLQHALAIVTEVGPLGMAGRIEEPALQTDVTSLCQVNSVKLLYFCFSSATIFIYFI